jgi:hypothetical protein
LLLYSSNLLLGFPNWPIIYFINYTPTSSLATFITVPSIAIRAIQDVHVSAASEAPEAEDSQDEHEAEDSLEGTSSTTSPPPALSEDLGLDKKRKHMKELLSSNTFVHKNVAGEASALEDEEELFDALNS